MTNPSDPPRGRSRRAVLSACGAGLAALAGCADLDVTGGGETPAYDPDRLRTVAEQGAPSRRDAFPVAVTDEDRERHYDRGRSLVETIPERPEVPNGVVARRLREEREHVLEHLGESPDAETGLGRLSEARGVRADAAEANGAYRAATGEIDAESVPRRREELRAALRRFEADWAYRGGDPATALVVGAELEDLTGAGRSDAEAWPPFPEDPVADVFGAGEVVRTVESGEATLEDAERLRARYLDGIDARPYRAAITVAAHRLDRRASRESRRLDEYLDASREDAPFGRDIEDVPAGSLYRRARVRLEDDASRGERRAGNHAMAALTSARRLADARTFDAVIDAIRGGEYGPPEDADRVVTAREEAVAALETAWATEPTAVSAELAWPAHDALTNGHRNLERTDGHEHDVHQALGWFAFARLYAEAVPGAVEAVLDALDYGEESV